MEIFQERLRLCREGMDKTQEEAAKALGIGFRTYCRYEHGESDPSLIPLVKLADYFQVSLDYLTGRTDIRDVNR